MRAIIPVAGVGSRLRPHTFSRPKVLLNVAGKPILAHILDKIQDEGITSATIIVGYMGDMVEEYVRTNYADMDVTFVTQDDPMGLGHSIYLARQTFENNEPLLIILGDTIFDVDLRNVFKSQSTSIGVKSVEDPKRFGVVELNNNFITRLVEKPEHPSSNLAIVGIYYIRNTDLLRSCLENLITNDVRTRGEYQLTDALQMMISQGEKMNVFHVDGWFDCGKPETLLSTNRYLLDKHGLTRKIPESVIIPPVYISPTAEITQSVIGPYATISDGTVIRHSIIRNSIIDEKAQVSKSLLDNSIVGSNAVIKGSYKRINAGDSSEIDFY
jgi:glucose-1-phosphate thymidylyltransferase